MGPPLVRMLDARLRTASRLRVDEHVEAIADAAPALAAVQDE